MLTSAWQASCLAQSIEPSDRTSHPDRPAGLVVAPALAGASIRTVLSLHIVQTSQRTSPPVRPEKAQGDAAPHPPRRISRRSAAPAGLARDASPIRRAT